MVLLEQVQKKLHKVETRLAQASMDKVLWKGGEGEGLTEPTLGLFKPEVVMDQMGKEK